MTRRPKDIGTAAETAVVRYLATAGFPHAERRALNGSTDRGDITGTPGICWEVKGGNQAKTASDGLIGQWLIETETERGNAGADIGVLVVQRAGIGPANAGRWWAVLRLHDIVWLYARSRTEAISGAYSDKPIHAPARLHLSEACLLLRAGGYGDPLTPWTMPDLRRDPDNGPHRVVVDVEEVGRG